MSRMWMILGTLGLIVVLAAGYLVLFDTGIDRTVTVEKYRAYKAKYQGTDKSKKPTEWFTLSRAYPYDDIQRIPLIAAGPGISPGLVCDEFVYLHDLTPTILHWAGADRFPCSNAQNLEPCMQGKPLERSRDDVYMARYQHPYPYEQRWVRTRRYKYGFNAFDTDELYYLEGDPHEMINVIDDPDYAEVKADMIERMHAHMTELEDPLIQCFNVWSGRDTHFQGMPKG